MATMTGVARQFVSDPSAALPRIKTEDARLMQRINTAATELHQLWSEGWLADPDDRANRRTRIAALQAAVDRLYEQRRQLVAQQALGEPPARRMGARLDLVAA